MAHDDIPLDLAEPSSSGPLLDSRRKSAGSKFKIELKWSKNAAEHSITALKAMEKAAGAIPIPGLSAVFFLTAEIVRDVDDTKENKKGFKLLAGEANALAQTLWEECAELQMDERRASLWQSLEPHIKNFTDILKRIKGSMERKHGRSFLVSLGNSKKDAGFIKELHNELKAAVDRFNVAMQVANRTALDRIEESQSASGEVLNRIETLLLRMQETSQELEHVDTRPEHPSPHIVGTGASSVTAREVVQPSSMGGHGTSELTSSGVPFEVDVVMPGTQVALPFPDEQIPLPQASSREYHAEQSMLGFTDYRPQASAIPISRAESSPASLPSTDSTTSTNLFARRLDPDILTDGSLTPRPQRPHRTSTIDSTPSHVLHRAFPMPIPQIEPLQAYNHRPEFPMPNFSKSGNQSLQISRAETLPTSLPSTHLTNSTNPIPRYMPPDALTDGSSTPRPQVARYFTMGPTFSHSPARATPHSVTVVMPIPKIPMPELPSSSIHPEGNGDPGSGLQSSPSQARASIEHRNSQSVYFSENYRSESPTPMENWTETSPTFSAYPPDLSSSRGPSDTHDPASGIPFLGGFNPRLSYDCLTGDHAIRGLQTGPHHNCSSYMSLSSRPLPHGGSREEHCLPQPTLTQHNGPPSFLGGMDFCSQY